MGDWRGRDGFSSGFPAPPVRAVPKRRWASASSPQAAHPSPPRGPRRLARSAACPLPARGPHGRLAGEEHLVQGFQLLQPEPRRSVAGHPPRRRKLRIPRLRGGREGSLAPLRLLSPRGRLCWSRAGAPWATGGGGTFSSGFPAPPARAARKRRWAYASRREATGSPSPPWGRRAGRSA